MKIKSFSKMQKANSQHFLPDAKLYKKQHDDQVSLVNLEINFKSISDDLIKSASPERRLTLLME